MVRGTAGINLSHRIRHDETDAQPPIGDFIPEQGVDPMPRIFGFVGLDLPGYH
jgi:hypothetical protein